MRPKAHGGGKSRLEFTLGSSDVSAAAPSLYFGPLKHLPPPPPAHWGGQERHQQPLPAALTGFEMMQIMASGQCWAQAAVRVATMEALVLNRSSRVMPESDPNQDVHRARDDLPAARPAPCGSC